MNKETATKRTYTVPVLLVLLTCSLIGIVLLFSLNLQHGQETKRQDGEAVIAAGQAAKVHILEAASALDELASSSDTADRLGIVYRLGASFRGKDELLAFIEASAERVGPGAETADAERPRKLLEAIDDSLEGIGAHSGPLSEAERQYVRQASELYRQLEQTIADFKLETGDKMVEMTAQSGGDWVQIGQRLGKTLDQAQVGANGAFAEQTR